MIEIKNVNSGVPKEALLYVDYYLLLIITAHQTIYLSPTDSLSHAIFLNLDDSSLVFFISFPNVAILSSTSHPNIKDYII